MLRFVEIVGSQVAGRVGIPRRKSCMFEAMESMVGLSTLFYVSCLPCTVFVLAVPGVMIGRVPCFLRGAEIGVFPRHFHSHGRVLPPGEVIIALVVLLYAISLPFKRLVVSLVLDYESMYIKSYM